MAMISDVVPAHVPVCTGISAIQRSQRNSEQRNQRDSVQFPHALRGFVRAVFNLCVALRFSLHGAVHGPDNRHSNKELIQVQLSC